MREDQIIVEVLPDGTVKMECPGSISSANHGNAEAILSAIARDLGGETTTTKTKRTHVHTHTKGKQWITK